jgi:hypothetical protein
MKLRIRVVMMLLLLTCCFMFSSCRQSFDSWSSEPGGVTGSEWHSFVVHEEGYNKDIWNCSASFVVKKRTTYDLVYDLSSVDVGAAVSAVVANVYHETGKEVRYDPELTRWMYNTLGAQAVLPSGATSESSGAIQGAQQIIRKKSPSSEIVWAVSSDVEGETWLMARGETPDGVRRLWVIRSVNETYEFTDDKYYTWHTAWDARKYLVYFCNRGDGEIQNLPGQVVAWFYKEARTNSFVFHPVSPIELSKFH